ncbi:MAG TPA: IPT/TIG domain-containing protein, partial [Planctomycetota bacterium]|nr:IPT/TIG domain-containing protein [Planctomycetota bacterium]
GFRAHLGFLGGADPEPTNAPVVFGLTPPFGPGAGGTPVLVSGLHFDHLGAGPTLDIVIGSASATDLVVLGDTQVTLKTPPGDLGPADVRVLNANGFDVLPDAFVFTPAVVAPAQAPIGSSVTLADYGPVGGIFSLWMSPFTTSIPLPPWGTLLIGPSQLVKVAEQPYPAPHGVHELVLGVPNDPTLAGLPVHFQAAAVTSLAPLTIVLTNRSTTLVL